MIWFLAVLYRVFRWVAEKAGLRVGGRVSSSARDHALEHVRRAVTIDGSGVSLADGPCCVRVGVDVENRSRRCVDVVGVNLRVGRSPAGGTFHRLVWSADANGPLPADVDVSGFDGENGGRIAFDVALPAAECLATDPELWLDGTVRLGVQQGGRARFGLGELDLSLSPTRLSLDERALSAAERDRLAADRNALRERFVPDVPDDP